MTVLGIREIQTGGVPTKYVWPVLGSSLGLIAGVGLFKSIKGILVPTTLRIDRQGVDASWSRPRRCPWSSIDLIDVAKPEGTSKDVLGQEHIWLYGEPNWSEGTAGSFRDRPLIQIDPWGDFDVAPAVILDALDRFRPGQVMIHDPRRIVD